jgi:hypothetical protein
MPRYSSALFFLSAWFVPGGKAEVVTGKRAMLIQLATVHCLVATALLGVSGLFYDRYVIDASWALVFVLACSIEWSKRWQRVLATALLAPTLLFSVFGVREYFEWNRARWAAFEYLKTRGVTLNRMDGGYEINQYLIGGWHGELRLRLPGMSVVDDEFILSFNEVRGYRTLREFPYEGFMGIRQRSVYAQQREEGFTPAFEVRARAGVER